MHVELLTQICQKHVKRTRMFILTIIIHHQIKFEREPYLENVTNLHFRKIIMKFRCGDHKLEIDRQDKTYYLRRA